MPKRKPTFPPDVEVLTPEECGILWRNLKNHWLDRSDNYEEARVLVQRLYRRWMGMDRVVKIKKDNTREVT